MLSYKEEIIMPNSKENVNEKYDYQIQFKSRLKAPKRDFETYPISDIPHKLKLHNFRYESGF